MFTDVHSDIVTKQDKFAPAARRAAYGRRVLWTSMPLIISDLVAMSIAFLLASLFTGVPWNSGASDPLMLLPWVSVAFVLVNLIEGHYPGTGINPIVEMRQSVIATTLLFAVFFVASAALEGGETYSGYLIFAFAPALFLVPALRPLTRAVFSRYDWWGHATLIVGNQKQAQIQYRFLSDNPRFGLRPVGMVTDGSHMSGKQGSNCVHRLGSIEQTPQIAADLNVSCAVVTMPGQSRAQIRQFLDELASDIPHVMIVSDMNGFPSLWSRTNDWGGIAAIGLEEKLVLPLPRLAKRVADLLVAVAGSVVLAPAILLIALGIKLTSRGPVFFCHKRVGRGGRPFYAWKFRTMYTNGDELLRQHLAGDGAARKEWEREQKLKQDPRITPIGRILRRTSLDELPQFWNILRGEMSLVGPRPIVESEIVRYGPSFSRYVKVVPGLSGLWQVSGRNNTAYSERVRLDDYYVRNWSPWLDLYILAKTVKVVLTGEGAY